MQEIKKAILEAGKILKDRYFCSFTVHEKEKGHLAADVDMEVELFLKEQLYKIDPSIGFYGEETGGIEHGTKRWIVDALDGTANFIFGVPYFCTSIALEEEGKITFAMVYNPITEELFEACEEKSGALCNGIQINVSTANQICESRVVFGFSANFKYINRYHTEWGDVFDGCLKGLGLLSPAMNLCNVARGRTDAFIDFGCSMEGQAAGGYILEKAGGKILNYDKSPWNHCEKGIIAANRQELLKF
jgi:fructose-1,6-bisphosphatase/inositol monophosphatase family enzyme